MTSAKPNKDNIYTKLKNIRKEIGKIKKEEVNEFQKFKYVSEYTYFNKINPLLDKEGLIMTFEDTDIPFHIQKEGKEWSVSFQKQTIITDVETEKSLTFKFWGAGQNTDIAKAKGSADTYAVKYFLQKFFMIPTSDKSVLDPDSISKEEEKEVDKCFKCNYNFSVSLLKEAKTITGEVKKLCPSCYNDAVKKSKK